MNTKLEKENSWKLLALFDRKARKAGFSDEWTRAVIKQATESNRENLLAVLAEAFQIVDGKIISYGKIKN
jgi:hypothetical protein